jgi:signal transduction histidine kinase
MSFTPPRFLNRIGGQMALLIVVSLIVIHAVITASFLIREHEGLRVWHDGPGAFVTAVRMIAAAAPAERQRLIADITRAFPDMNLRPAAAMPTTNGGENRWLHFLEERLGPGYRLVTPANAPHSVAVLLPDGAVLTARLPQRFKPPFLGGPIAMTIMFIVLSVTLLGLWAARALTRPLSAFAETAENFSLDGAVAALPEKGPEEIRTVARALNRMRERIRKLVDDRTRLLAAMGHDLRTPITRLRLRSEFVGDEDLRGHMLRDLDQMKAMTDGVLSFLRDGEPREAATRIDLASSLQTISDQFGDLGHTARYEGPDHLTVTARPDDLQRAVANLVDNAVRHGTSAVVRLATTPQGIVIEVEDDGPGIPDDSKAAMLEAFVRGEAARTMDDRSGFGLGLSIARAVAEAHGGTLTLHDRVPHGLIARITLPAADPARASLPDRHAPARRAAG